MIPIVPLRLVLAALLSVLVTVASTTDEAAAQESITTPEIVAAGTNFDCMQWRISGTCFWLDCSPLCSVKTSIHVEHFSPALVVSTMGETGDNPWTEISWVHGTVEEAAHKAQFAIQGVNMSRPLPGGKFVNRQGAHDKREGMHFKAANVIGGPGNIANIAATFGFPLFCPMTDVTPLYPYFLSGVDAVAWTTGTFEALYAATWIPGMREIGSRSLTNPLGNTWGSVFPRHGFVDQPDDVKAGAVIAQRAADIVYKSGQPHLYTRVGDAPGAWGDDGFRVFEPEELEEANPDNSLWQMLVPKRESDCKPFGEDDRFAAPGAGFSDDTYTEGAYTWLLWRPYECCKDEGSYIGKITF